MNEIDLFKFSGGNGESDLMMLLFPLSVAMTITAVLIVVTSLIIRFNFSFKKSKDRLMMTMYWSILLYSIMFAILYFGFSNTIAGITGYPVGYIDFSPLLSGVICLVVAIAIILKDVTVHANKEEEGNTISGE